MADEPDVPAQPAMERETLLGAEQSSNNRSSPDDNAAQSQQVSALELENSLLKQEVVSLNQEMNSVIKRAKSAQEGNISISVILLHWQI